MPTGIGALSLFAHPTHYHKTPSPHREPQESPLLPEATSHY